MTVNLAEQFPDLVIRASAGTGKTYRLTNRYLGLLHCGEPPDHILASTFARKAAGEILERLLCGLAEASSNESSLKSLQQALEQGPLTQARCATLLESLIRQIHRLRVGTLDSVFIQTAGSFSLEFGLPGGWKILEDLDDRAIRIESIRRLLRHESGEFDSLITFLGLLQQGDSSRDVLGSLLAIVGDFYSIFLESSPTAWSGETKLHELSEAEWTTAMEQFHEAPLPADKRFGKAHDSSIAKLDAQDWQGFLTGGLAKQILSDNLTYYKKPIEPELYSAYQPLIDHARAKLVNQLLYQTEATYRLLEKYHAIYHPLKLSRKGLRFEDITRILSENLDSAKLPEIEYRLDSAIHHLLLDEFQDTSLTQWNVVRHFAEEVNRSPGKSFFCVGDVKQAIYGWRGGESEIFDSVQSEFIDIRDEPMDLSYRSSPVIMETVNRVFGTLSENSSLVPEKNDEPDLLLPVREFWNARFHTHQTAKNDYAGFCRLATYPVDEETGRTDKTQKYRTTADYVRYLYEEHPGCSIGVLTRTNRTVGQLIYRLRNPRQGEPVFASEEGGNPLTDSAAVIYLLSVLKLAAHPGDRIARFNVVHSPLAEFFEWKLFEQRDPRTENFARSIRRQLIDRGYGRTIDAWANAMVSSCDEREWNRLQQLVELAWSYESRATLDPYDFVQFVEATRVESPSSADVRVMTIHQSKGLQFDIVVLPELEGLILSGRDKYIMERDRPTEPISKVMRYFSKTLLPIVPESLQRMSQTHSNRSMNEALCLLYVAMTRAIHALHMIVPKEASRQTSARILIEALSEQKLEPESELFTYGDPDWYAPHEAEFRARTRSNLLPQTENSKPLQLAKSSGRHKRNLHYVTPSTHLEQRVSFGATIPAEQSLARARGSLIHAWFEEIEWLDDGPPDDQTLRKLAGRFLKPGLDLEQLLSDFQSMMKGESVRNNLSQEAYQSQIAPQLFPDLASSLDDGSIELEVHRERRVAFRTESELVNGIVDRLVLYRDQGKVIAADVIDYKTDSVHSDADVKPLRDLYRAQLQQYGRAMQVIYGLDSSQIVTRLGLLSTGIFV